jgi:hypothetical protein
MLMIWARSLSWLVGARDATQIETASVRLTGWPLKSVTDGREVGGTAPGEPSERATYCRVVNAGRRAVARICRVQVTAQSAVDGDRTGCSTLAATTLRSGFAVQWRQRTRWPRPFLVVGAAARFTQLLAGTASGGRTRRGLRRRGGGAVIEVDEPDVAGTSHHRVLPGRDDSPPQLCRLSGLIAADPRGARR